MKILLICEAVFPENKGGLERWMLWFAESLAKLNFEVEYINASGVNEIREKVKYTSVKSKNWSYVGNGKRSIKQSINFAFAIRPLIRISRPAVIYSVQAPIFSLFSLALYFRRPWLLVVEWFEIWSIGYWRNYLGFIPGSIGFFLQSLSQRVGDIRVVFSKRCLKQLGEHNSKNVLLPGLYMESEIAKLNVFKQRENLLFLGRFVGEKQPILALEVAMELRQLGWTGYLNIVGTGPLGKFIQQEISNNEMDAYVKLIENASHSELEDCFSTSFLLLHPSKREGYGLAIIESAERGIPSLLIDYPENASIDLQIPSQIISESDSPKYLAKLAYDAYFKQESNYDLLKAWQTNTLPNMKAKNSVEKIISLINENVMK
jgi:glycosyltransferase involved in cell wall biosynthesis